MDGIDWTGSGPEVGPDSVSDELPEPDETPDDELLLPVGDRMCFRDFLLSRSLLPRRFEIEKLRFGFFGSHDGVSMTSTSTSSPEFVSEPFVSELFEWLDPPQESSFLAPVPIRTGPENGLGWARVDPRPVEPVRTGSC